MYFTNGDYKLLDSPEEIVDLMVRVTETNGNLDIIQLLVSRYSLGLSLRRSKKTLDQKLIEIKSCKIFLKWLQQKKMQQEPFIYLTKQFSSKVVSQKESEIEMIVLDLISLVDEEDSNEARNYLMRNQSIISSRNIPGSAISDDIEEDINSSEFESNLVRDVFALDTNIFVGFSDEGYVPIDLPFVTFLTRVVVNEIVRLDQFNNNSKIMLALMKFIDNNEVMIDGLDHSKVGDDSLIENLEFTLVTRDYELRKRFKNSTSTSVVFSEKNC